MTWNTFTQSYLVYSEAIQLTMHYAAGGAIPWRQEIYIWCFYLSI